MESTVEEKLRALYSLQTIDSKIDEIKKIRGELPMEVGDLEDDITGLETRTGNIDKEITKSNDNILANKNAIKESKALIKKYEGQQMQVKNSREYDALTKEHELQNLEILASEKKINQFTEDIVQKEESLKETKGLLKERKKDLEHKKKELNEITSETEKEEKNHSKNSIKAATMVEVRLLNAYQRIRNNARNGLAVVSIERDACGGCFNKIPPQRQLDIRQRQKVIVCEHCGRILVDTGIADSAPKVSKTKKESVPKKESAKKKEPAAKKNSTSKSSTKTAKKKVAKAN
ncbi:hypothetical protein JYT36_00190 [Bacteroidales bacterium AH-315-N07]|nr:hypothetical protein [Bacteroidales bacterium AH-315-N07]